MEIWSSYFCISYLRSVFVTFYFLLLLILIVVNLHCWHFISYLRGNLRFLVFANHTILKTIGNFLTPDNQQIFVVFWVHYWTLCECLCRPGPKYQIYWRWWSMVWSSSPSIKGGWCQLISIYLTPLASISAKTTWCGFFSFLLKLRILRFWAMVQEKWKKFCVSPLTRKKDENIS